MKRRGRPRGSTSARRAEAGDGRAAEAQGRRKSGRSPHPKVAWEVEAEAHEREIEAAVEAADAESTRRRMMEISPAAVVAAAAAPALVTDDQTVLFEEEEERDQEAGEERELPHDAGDEEQGEEEEEEGVRGTKPQDSISQYEMLRKGRMQRNKEYLRRLSPEGMGPPLKKKRRPNRITVKDKRAAAALLQAASEKPYKFRENRNRSLAGVLRPRKYRKRQQQPDALAAAAAAAGAPALATDSSQLDVDTSRLPVDSRKVLPPIMKSFVDLSLPASMRPGVLQPIIALNSRVLRHPTRAGRGPNDSAPFLTLQVTFSLDTWAKAEVHIEGERAVCCGVAFALKAFHSKLRDLVLLLTSMPPAPLREVRPAPRTRPLNAMPALLPLGEDMDAVSRVIWALFTSVARGVPHIPAAPTPSNLLGLLLNDIHPFFSRAGLCVPLPWPRFFQAQVAVPQDQETGAAHAVALVFFATVCCRAFCMDAPLLLEQATFHPAPSAPIPVSFPPALIANTEAGPTSSSSTTTATAMVKTTPSPQ